MPLTSLHLLTQRICTWHNHVGFPSIGELPRTQSMQTYVCPHVCNFPSLQQSIQQGAACQVKLFHFTLGINIPSVPGQHLHGKACSETAMCTISARAMLPEGQVTSRVPFLQAILPPKQTSMIDPSGFSITIPEAPLAGQPLRNLAPDQKLLVAQVRT